MPTTTASPADFEFSPGTVLRLAEHQPFVVQSEDIPEFYRTYTLPSKSRLSQISKSDWYYEELKRERDTDVVYLRDQQQKLKDAGRSFEERDRNLQREDQDALKRDKQEQKQKKQAPERKSGWTDTLPGWKLESSYRPPPTNADCYRPRYK